MDHPTFFSSGDSLPLHRNVGVEEHEVKETEPLGLGPWLFSDRTGPNLSNVPMGPVAGGPQERNRITMVLYLQHNLHSVGDIGGWLLILPGQAGVKHPRRYCVPL